MSTLTGLRGRPRILGMLSFPETLGEISSWASRRYGSRVAFEVPPLPSGTHAGDLSRPSRISFAEFDAHVSGISNSIVKALDDYETPKSAGSPKVLVRGESGALYFASMLAASRAGAIAVTVHSDLTATELKHVIKDSGALLELAPAHVEQIESLGRVDVSWNLENLGDVGRQGPDDIAAIFYTSGTTGHPKGVALTNKALLADLRLASLYPFRDDLLVEALPTPHIMGFMVLAGALVAGIRVLAFERFSPVRVLDAIESRRATLFVGVPAMYRMMLESGAAHRDLKSVHAWMSAADVMPPDLARQFQNFGSALTIAGHSIGKAFFIEAYGMVEYSGAATVKVALPVWDPFSESMGVPLPGTRIKVVDEAGKEVNRGEVGEIAIQGDKLLHSYQDRSSPVESGWLRTGDLARRGLVFNKFAGRSKDVIVSGGYTVYPIEIEERLREFDGVADAAVIGMDDPVLGERLVAFVEPVDGIQLEIRALDEWVKTALARYKHPSEYHIVDALPRGSTRKVVKDTLRRSLEAKRDGRDE